MKRALVFSGGGARGAYELGVWKALNELNIPFDIVTGTSVGALNGAMFAIGNYDLAEKLWLNLEPSQVVKTEEKDPKVVYAKFLKEAATGGANTEPLEELLKLAVDEKSVRKSKIKYGLATCTFPILKPQFLTIDDIPEGQLIDYLVASATAYPTFRPKTIGDSKFIDGGFYDNLPINMAIDMGADEIIAVNLQAIGIYRKVKTSNIDIEIIMPSRELGSFLMFDKNLVKVNSQIGYQDTMKFFEQMDGEYFSFHKDEIVNNGKEFAINFRKLIAKIFDTKASWLVIDFAKMFSSKRVLKKFKSLHQREYSNSMSKLIQGIDACGKVFEMDDLKIYNFQEFNNEILEKVDGIKKNNNDFLKHADITFDPLDLERFARTDKKLLAIYILRKIELFEDGKVSGLEIYSLFSLYSNIALSALYLRVVLKCNDTKDCFPRGIRYNG